MKLEPEIQFLQQVLNDSLIGKKSVSILEAGCGASTKLDVPLNARLIGIDISDAQLQRHRNLNQRICADIQTHSFPAEEYDVIISWFLLEHVPEPLKALDNMQSSLRKGGILILALPNIMSVKGIATKLTPHFLHVAFYRYILGRQDAGKNDTVPFRTYLRSTLAPKRLRDYAETRGLAVIYFQKYEGAMPKRVIARHPLLRVLTYSVGGLLNLFSGNRIAIRDNNFVIVLQRPLVDSRLSHS